MLLLCGAAAQQQCSSSDAAVATALSSPKILCIGVDGSNAYDYDFVQAYNALRSYGSSSGRGWSVSYHLLTPTKPLSKTTLDNYDVIFLYDLGSYSHDTSTTMRNSFYAIGDWYNAKRTSVGERVLYERAV